MGFSHADGPDGPNAVSLSPGCILGTASGGGEGTQDTQSGERRGARSLQCQATQSCLPKDLPNCSFKGSLRLNWFHNTVMISLPFSLLFSHKCTEKFT